LLHSGERVDALTFDYGQRHAKEIDAARALAAHYKVRHDVVALPLAPLLFGSSALIGGVDVPDGHYEDWSMKATVVPHRNLIMLAIAASVASARKYNTVAFAAHAGDHAIYPDCRTSFIDAARLAIRRGDWDNMQLLAPFAYKTKRDIAALARLLKVPIEATWSCYKGGETHCGKCGTCVERAEALA
jgi:7-cyano-7-deazaguanine synthase